MSRDLDTRARHAAANLRSAVESAELSSTPPLAKPTRRPVIAVLRPVIIGALLLIGSAVGVALVADSSPPTTTAPTPTTATIANPTTIAAAEPVETTPPTTLYVAPIVPTPAPPTTEAADTTPPGLVITFPGDGAHLETETVRFEGTTEPGARVFAGRYEADVDNEGTWEIVLILNPGSNVARFTARDQAGNESEAAVTVHYDVIEATTTTTVEKPETTTTTEEKELAEFSAKAVYGSCSETPPYDVYHGTGHPGSVVKIESEYGSATVEVGGEGMWESKVIFEGAPANTPFVVRVKDQYGRGAEFEFVYLPA